MRDFRKQPSFWRRGSAFMRAALRDNDADFTVGPIGPALGLLAIPMMLEMAMESVFAVVDIAFVSRLGTDAVAAVGITEALVTVLYAVGLGLGMGVTAMVSRRIGAKNPEAAARVAGQAIWLAAGLSALIGVSGVAFAADLLRLMGASAAVVETGHGYTAVMLGGAASILYLILLNAAFRGAGDAAMALRSLWLANGVNLVLDPCLIFGLGPFPELGVTGAAIATTIGRGVGIAYQLAYLLGGRGRLRFGLRHLAPAPTLIRRLLVLSLGGVSQMLIATSSWIVLMRIVALFGSPAVAAYAISLRLLEFALLPAWGLSNAAATLVGQNLGAGRVDRAERFVWRAAQYNVLLMAAFGMLLWLLAPQIARLFATDLVVLDHTIDCLRILALGYPLYALGMVMVQALNGAGDTASPSLLNFLCFWLIQIPLAFVLATETPFGPNGVFAAAVMSESLLTALSVYVFRLNRWKHKPA